MYCRHARLFTYCDLSMSPFYPLLLIHVHIMSAEMSIAVEWIESMGIACLPMTPAQDILMMPAPAWIFDTYCMRNTSVSLHGCALKNASRRRNIPVAPKISTCTAKGAIAVQTRLPLWSMLRVPNKCLIERKAWPTFPFMSSKNAGSVSGRLYKQRLGWGIL